MRPSKLGAMAHPRSYFYGRQTCVYTRPSECLRDSLSVRSQYLGGRSRASRVGGGEAQMRPSRPAPMV